MFQWFVWFPAFAEFTESSVLLRKKSIKNDNIMYDTFQITIMMNTGYCIRI